MADCRRDRQTCEREGWANALNAWRLESIDGQINQWRVQPIDESNKGFLNSLTLKRSHCLTVGAIRRMLVYTGRVFVIRGRAVGIWSPRSRTVEALTNHDYNLCSVDNRPLIEKISPPPSVGFSVPASCPFNFELSAPFEKSVAHT